MKRICLLGICLLLTNFTSFAQSNDESLSSYKLKISKDNLRNVDIEAEMTIQEPYLEMNPWGIPPEIDRGWASFVDIISLRNSQGKPVPYKWNDNLARWDLRIGQHSKIKIVYRVRLEHDRYNWDAGGGIDGRPTVWNEDTIFWVTKGLFMYCYEGSEHSKAEIEFQVPADWHISAPWIKISKKVFLAENLDQLDNNLLVIGKQTEKKIRVDDMSIMLVAPKNMSHRMELLNKTMKDILPVYKSVFRELPKTNYMICVSKNEVEDGEAYSNSFHQMFNDKDLSSRKIVWANTFAHEMFHYWTGVIYNDDVEGNYWFSEGFTDYYSSLALIRSGTISEQDFLKKLAFQFARYHSSQRLMKEKVNLVDAGKHKIRNWHLIYGGGATMAFILDIEIRKLTNGERSLDDFMARLYAEFGKKGKPFAIEDQVRILNELTQSDFNPVFAKYIQGTEPVIDLILSTCEKAGLSVAQYQSEFYLTPKKDMPNSIYKNLIGME